MHIGKEELKLVLFAGMNVEKESYRNHQKPLILIHKFSKCAGNKTEQTNLLHLSKVINYQKEKQSNLQFDCLIVWENNQIYKCIKKNKIPRNKHSWGRERPRLRKWWHWWKKLKIALRNGKIYLAHGLEKLILLKWPYYPRKFLAIPTIAFFIGLKQIILKFVWKHKKPK